MIQRWRCWRVGRIRECFVVIRKVTQVNEWWIVIHMKHWRFISKNGRLLFDFHTMFHFINHIREKSLAWTYCFARFWTYYYWWSWICWQLINHCKPFKLKIGVNRFGDITVVIVCIIIWNVHNSILKAKHHTLTFFSNKQYFRNIWKDGELMFSLWTHVAIMHKGNGRTKRNYQASYLKGQKKQGLHSKQMKTSRPHKPTMKKKLIQY